MNKPGALHPWTGRLQRGVLWLLTTARGPLTTPQLREALYPGEWRDWHRSGITTACAKFAEPAEPTRPGRPTRWRLKPWPDTTPESE